MADGGVCVSCQQPAKLLCPKCVQLKLPTETASFCCQECFKGAWATHKQLHKTVVVEDNSSTTPGFPEGWGYAVQRGRGRSREMPMWNWTGDLKPYPISPKRVVPPSIPRPDYADHPQGYPEGEMQSKQQNIVLQRSAKDIEGLRSACLLGRQALDAAARIIKPGVTTDEIDRVVHEVCCNPNPMQHSSSQESRIY